MTDQFQYCWVCGLEWRGAYTDCPGCQAQAGFKGLSDLQQECDAKDAEIAALMSRFDDDSCDNLLRRCSVIWAEHPASWCEGCLLARVSTLTARLQLLVLQWRCAAEVVATNDNDVLMCGSCADDVEWALRAPQEPTL